MKKHKLSFKEQMVEGSYLYSLTEKQKSDYSKFTIARKKQILHRFKPYKFK